jgi:hypothetical protein
MEKLMTLLQESVGNYRWLVVITVASSVVFSHHSRAADSVDRLLQCRRLGIQSERLACYDALADSQEHAGRARVAAPEPSGNASFGLAEQMRKPEQETLEGVIREARSSREGWIVKLEDGSTWRQEDSSGSALDPQIGQRVLIRRAALGSYRLMLNDNVGFKVRRIR